MSSTPQWVQMKWKKKDIVYVRKKSWEGEQFLVEYKYNLSHNKIYKGSRPNFSAIASNITVTDRSTTFNTTNSKKRKRSISPRRRTTKRSVVASSTLDIQSLTEIANTVATDQKVTDFLCIAPGCPPRAAEGLLRANQWDVSKAIEFYFKHQDSINGSSSSSSTPGMNQSNSIGKRPDRRSKSKSRDSSHSTKRKTVKTQQLTSNSKSIPTRKARQNKDTQDIKFGKAGTRTEAQKKLVKEKFAELYASFSDHEIICFTDGACRGNPGPAGSGCVVLFGKQNASRYIQKSLALGRHTNNIGELYAIGLALHLIQQHPSSSRWTQLLCNQHGNRKTIVRVLSDSRYSIGVSSKGWTAKKNKELIGWIRNELDKVSRKGFIVFFHWVGGHCDIEFNEIADQLANAGVDGSNMGHSVDIKQPPNLFNAGESNKGGCGRMISSFKPTSSSSTVSMNKKEICRPKVERKRKYHEINESDNQCGDKIESLNISRDIGIGIGINGISVNGHSLKGIKTNDAKECMLWLIDLRKELAVKLRMDEFRVFNDVAMDQLARFLPSTMDDLSHFETLNEVQRTRFGKDIVDTVKNYMACHAVKSPFEELRTQKDGNAEEVKSSDEDGSLPPHKKRKLNLSDLDECIETLKEDTETPGEDEQEHLSASPPQSPAQSPLLI